MLETLEKEITMTEKMSDEMVKELNDKYDNISVIRRKVVLDLANDLMDAMMSHEFTSHELHVTLSTILTSVGRVSEFTRALKEMLK